MPALFPRWSNGALRAFLLAAGGVLVGVPALAMVFARSPYATGERDPVDQPVMFDHRHHARDAGLDCRYCHDQAEKSARAGVPPVSLCMGCHGQIWAGAPVIEPLRRAYHEGEPLAWARVHNLPGFVYFDHSVHLAKGVGCESCHGRVDRMARVYQVAPLTMDWCLDCHRHPERELRPLDRVAEPGAPLLPHGTALDQAHSLHIAPPTTCSGCHRLGPLDALAHRPSNAARPRLAPRPPRRAVAALGRGAGGVGMLEAARREDCPLP